MLPIVVSIDCRLFYFFVWFIVTYTKHCGVHRLYVPVAYNIIIDFFWQKKRRTIFHFLQCFITKSKPKILQKKSVYAWQPLLYLGNYVLYIFTVKKLHFDSFCKAWCLVKINDMLNCILSLKKQFSNSFFHLFLWFWFNLRTFDNVILDVWYADDLTYYWS